MIETLVALELNYLRFKTTSSQSILRLQYNKEFELVKFFILYFYYPQCAIILDSNNLLAQTVYVYNLLFDYLKLWVTVPSEEYFTVLPVC